MHLSLRIQRTCDLVVSSLNVGHCGNTWDTDKHVSVTDPEAQIPEQIVNILV